MTLKLRLRAVHAVAAFVILAGCGSFSPTSTTSGDLSVRAVQTDAQTGSWMMPEATSEDLLYVTNFSDVLVFSYPQGKLVGTLKHFYSSVGECVDNRGDVFVTNAKPDEAVEYAHGGTKRIGSFPVPKSGPVGCAISTKTGDLAISGDTSYIEIYKQAKGKGIAVSDKDMWYGQFCTYDDDGDLFFLGLANPKGKLQLSKLRNGASAFTNIHPNGNISVNGGIEWNDGYLTTVSEIPHSKTDAIARFKVTGSKADLVSQTPLDTAFIILQYFIDGSVVVVPNLAQSGPNNVLLYKYPSGGGPTGMYTQNILSPRGVVVSHVSSTSRT